MNRFLIPAGHKSGDVVPLPPDEAAHAARVLRLRRDDTIELLDGEGGKWRGVIEEINRDAARALLGEAVDPSEADIEVALFQGMPKFEKLELIVQKAAELGARRVVPVLMERSVVKLNEKDGEKRAERLRRIALEAAKQCGRAAVPRIDAPTRLSDALLALAAYELKLMPWEEERAMKLRTLHENHRGPRSIALLIGPEGGIAPGEAERARAVGALAVSLGPRVLRTETAAIASLALTMGLWGDLM